MEESLFCPKAIEIINKLFTVFYAICNGFEKQFADVEKLKLTKAQWVMAFMEEKITEWKQIEKAITTCRRKTNLVYIPSIGDFLSWIEEDKPLNFLPKERAYTLAYEYMRGDLSIELSEEQMLVLRHAINASDRHFLRNNSRSATEPVFYRNYEIAIRDFKNGELKPIPKAMENKHQDDDPWKTMKKYGVLPQYAHLTSRDKAMPVIEELLKKNGGGLSRELPYDKKRRS